MDFYAIKFVANSTLTGETYVAYIFGKKRQTPEFKVAILNRKTLQEYEIPDINKDYISFKSDIEMLSYKIKKDKRVSDLSKQFEAYFYTTIKKYGFDIISTKFHLSVQDGDPYVLKAIIQDILFDWANETTVKLIAQRYFYEDLTWLLAAKEKGDEGAYEYLKRADVTNAQEVFPIIDPVEGTHVLKLDVGDPIFVIKMTTEENERKDIIEGHLISKEIIPNTEHIFLKIDLGNNLVGKTVVQRNLKILINENKLTAARNKRDRSLEPDKMDIIGDLATEYKKKGPDLSSKFSSLDVILVISFSVIGILIVILIAIWLGAV